jgi:hypothetical protein
MKKPSRLKPPRPNAVARIALFDASLLLRLSGVMSTAASKAIAKAIERKFPVETGDRGKHPINPADSEMERLRDAGY